MRAFLHPVDWQRYKANVLILLPFSHSKWTLEWSWHVKTFHFIEFVVINRFLGPNLYRHFGTSGLMFSASRATLGQLTCFKFDFRVVTLFIDDILKSKHGWQGLHRCQFCARFITFLRNVRFHTGKLMKNAFWLQFHSFWGPSRGVTGVPGGFKNGPFRGFGFHFGIAIAMSWATWGPFCIQSIDNVTKQTC